VTLVLGIIAVALALAGVAGCLLPVLPGPPLAFAGLVLQGLASGWNPFGWKTFLGMAFLMAVVTALDYVAFAAGAKRFGASKLGVWCSVAGLLLGLLFFNVIGMFLGAFAGAVVGEMIAGRSRLDAVKAGVGVFIGTLFGMGFKIAYCVLALGLIGYGILF
jgi:hypothetical protein